MFAFARSFNLVLGALGRADVQERTLDGVFYPVDDAPAWDLFREIQAGTLEQLVELNGATTARVEFTPDTRDGREACIMRVAWKDE